MGNKIKFGIKNVHYALEEAEGYGTPKPLKGARAITLDPKGDKYTFYADNMRYYELEVNDGYDGDLEIALLTDDARKDLLGEEIDLVTKVLIEKVLTSNKKFALGFQIEGDVKGTRYWFYHCTAARTSLEAETKEENIEAKTDTVNISCSPGEDGIVRIKSTDETPEETYEDWFKSVVMVA